MAQKPLAQERWWKGTKYRVGATNYPDEMRDFLAVEETNRRTNGIAELTRLYGETQAKALQASGLVDQAAIVAASDEQLLAIDGIGPAKLKKLRGTNDSAPVEPEQDDAKGV